VLLNGRVSFSLFNGRVSILVHNGCVLLVLDGRVFFRCDAGVTHHEVHGSVIHEQDLQPGELACLLRRRNCLALAAIGALQERSFCQL